MVSSIIPPCWRQSHKMFFCVWSVPSSGTVWFSFIISIFLASCSCSGRLKGRSPLCVIVWPYSSMTRYTHWGIEVGNVWYQHCFQTILGTFVCLTRVWCECWWPHLTSISPSYCWQFVDSGFDSSGNSTTSSVLLRPLCLTSYSHCFVCTPAFTPKCFTMRYSHLYFFFNFVNQILCTNLRENEQREWQREREGGRTRLPCEPQAWCGARS